MGTSSLYGGPKKTILLPSDYNPEGTPWSVNQNAEQPEQDESDNENSDKNQLNNNPDSDNQIPPGISWSDIRRSVTRSMNHLTARNVKTAISRYTKALGGHTNATRQAKTARRTATKIISYFSGTPETIRTRFENAGIRFENRPTKDILNDICLLLAPVPNDFEDALANSAWDKTIADIAMDETIDLSLLESFNEELLQNMVGGFIKHYVYDKLIQQSEQGALARCNDLAKLNKLEKSIKKYIDGIVDGIVPDFIRSGMVQSDINKMVDGLFDAAYQQMEELQ